MSSETFTSILNRRLGTKLRAGDTQKAIVDTLIKGKTGAVEGTLKLRSEEELTDESIEAFHLAAQTYVDNLIEERIVNYDVFSDRTTPPSVNSSKKVTVQSAYGLFLRGSNKPISTFNLTRLLNSVLFSYVKEGMDSDSKTLNYLTGRLAHSATVTQVGFSTQQALAGRRMSVMFTYMTMPYSTFEVGGRQGSTDRSPTRLIDRAITTALNELLSPKTLGTSTNRLLNIDTRMSDTGGS